MEKINAFLNYNFQLSDTVHITVKTILIVITVFIITALILRLLKRVVTKKLPEEDRLKFTSVFS